MVPSETVYRVTGPPENFITAMTIGYWAVNDGNVGMWQKLQPGDVLLFHSTTKSEYASPVSSGVIGYARVGSKKYTKSKHWWVQEINDKENKWPHVFSLDHICTIGELSDSIDLSKGVHEKEQLDVGIEVAVLAESGIPIADLIEKAKSIDPDVPGFPVNGSISGLHDIYPQIIFSDMVDEWFQCHGDGPDELLEDALVGADEQEKILKLSKQELLQIAYKYVAAGPSHKNAWRRTRREDARQKKIIAQLEGNTCQVCGFCCEYRNKKNQKRYIIHVDHIIEKSIGGDERRENLWALCPNCHAKKTAGLLKIDVQNKLVTLDGGPIKIRDNHLFI